MAYIQKKSDTKYKICISNGYTYDGKKILKTRLVTIDASLPPKQKEKELQRLAMLFEDEIKKGNYIEKTESFERFCVRWLEDYAEKRLEKKTIHSYKMELKSKILPALGQIKLCELQPLHLIKFYDNLTEDGVRLDNKKGGYSSRTIKYQHQIISSILQTAVFWQILDTNIADRVKPPRGVSSIKKENFFDGDQGSRFLTFVQETQALKYVVLANVTMYGGLRTEEILALTWNDVDFMNCRISINKAMSYVKGEVFIKEPKNKSSIRTISLPKHVISLLKEFRLQSTTDSVFDFNYFTPNHWIKKVIQQYNDKYPNNKLNCITFHGLRHTAATLLISSGTDIKTVSGRLGHNDTSTTLNIYAHFLKNKDEDASEALVDILQKNK